MHVDIKQLMAGSQPGQGGDADPQVPDLRAQLLEAEAVHFQKTNPSTEKPAEKITASKRQLEDGAGDNGEEDIEAKRRRILEETRGIDADSDDSKSESSEEDSDDEDETAELLRELEKIKRERAERKEKEVCWICGSPHMRLAEFVFVGARKGRARARET